MKIIGGILLFTFSVFLNFIGLMSAMQTTLRELFPESSGVDLPPIRELEHEHTLDYRNFRRLFDRFISDPTDNFLARGHVIVGWKQGDDIKPLCLLFGKPSEYVVFDTDKDKWVSLSHDEFEKLGPNRRLTLVRAHDKAAAAHRPVPLVIQQARQHAHYKASQQAHYVASEEEKIQQILQDDYQNADHEKSAQKVQQAYHQAYDHVYKEEYQRYLNEH